MQQGFRCSSGVKGLVNTAISPPLLSIVVCVCVNILHWQTHRHACGATVHHRGGKATNTDRTRKKLNTIHQFELHDHACPSRYNEHHITNI